MTTDALPEAGDDESIPEPHPRETPVDQQDQVPVMNGNNLPAAHVAAVIQAQRAVADDPNHLAPPPLDGHHPFSVNELTGALLESQRSAPDSIAPQTGSTGPHDPLPDSAYPQPKCTYLSTRAQEHKLTTSPSPPSFYSPVRAWLCSRHEYPSSGIDPYV